MKNLTGLAMVVIILMSCSASHVQTQSPYPQNGRYNDIQARRSFDYYPSANMYYDRSCNQYIYQRGRSWITSSFLPPGVYLDNSPRYPVYYYGPDVWRDNSLHQSRYYAQPQVVYGKQYEQHRYRVHERRYHDRDDRYNY